MSLLLDKSYQDAADGLMPFVKNATREERSVEFASDLTVQEIVIEGDFERFILSRMDMWGGHLRFVIRDTEATDDDIAWRGEMAMHVPQLAHLMTAKAQMRIYRQQKVTIRTIKIINGREVSREDIEQEEWTEVTEEFERVAMRDATFFAAKE